MAVEALKRGKRLWFEMDGRLLKAVWLAMMQKREFIQGIFSRGIGRKSGDKYE